MFTRTANPHPGRPTITGGEAWDAIKLVGSDGDQAHPLGEGPIVEVSDI
jgi:hypothetical protein